MLRAVDPAELSTVLNGLAGALDGRGEQLGDIITQVDAFLGKLDPHLDTLQTDLHQLARTAARCTAQPLPTSCAR